MPSELPPSTTRSAIIFDIARGRTSANPLSRELLEAKYRDCAGRVLQPDAVSQSLDLVASMEKLDRVSVLTDTLAAGCSRDQSVNAAALARAS